MLVSMSCLFYGYFPHISHCFLYLTCLLFTSSPCFFSLLIFKAVFRYLLPFLFSRLLFYSSPFPPFFFNVSFVSLMFFFSFTFIFQFLSNLLHCPISLPPLHLLSPPLLLPSTAKHLVTINSDFLVI